MMSHSQRGERCMAVYCVAVIPIFGYANAPTVSWCTCSNLPQPNKINYYNHTVTFKNCLNIDKSIKIELSIYD